MANMKCTPVVAVFLLGSSALAITHTNRGLGQRDVQDPYERPSLTLFPPSNEDPATTSQDPASFLKAFFGATKAGKFQAASTIEDKAAILKPVVAPYFDADAFRNKRDRIVNTYFGASTTAAPQEALASPPSAASAAPDQAANGQIPRVVRDMGRIMQNLSSVVATAGGASIAGSGSARMPRAINDVKRILEDMSGNANSGSMSSQGSAADPAPSLTLLPTTTEAPAENKAFAGLLSGLFGGARKPAAPSAKGVLGLMPGIFGAMTPAPPKAASVAVPAPSLTLFPATTAAPAENKAPAGLLSGLFGGATKPAPPSAKGVLGLMPGILGAMTPAAPKAPAAAAMRNMFGGVFGTPPPATTQPVVQATTPTPRTVYVPVPVMPSRMQFRWPYHTVSQDAAP